MITVYHNSRCGKSRDCVAFLENKNQEIEIVKYLETPLSFDELSILLAKLKIKPIELVRVKESVWIEHFKNKTLSDAEIIQAIADFPILMERPVAVKGNKAVIARPLERINELL